MRSGSVLNVEASDLAIPKAKDVHRRLVLQPLRLILQRLAFEIADGLLDLHDDRAICGLGENDLSGRLCHERKSRHPCSLI